MATLNLTAFGAALVTKFLGEWQIHYPTDFFYCGWYSDDLNHMGGGARFLNVAIPQGSTIDAAYLTFTAYMSDDETTVRSKIVGEAVDTATGFSTLAVYQAKRGTDAGGANNDNRTVAEVLWDNIGTWELDIDYDSPEIKTIIQEIVDRDGWVSGNHMALWWDDHAGRGSTTENWIMRVTNANFKLHIDFTPPIVDRYFAWII